MSALITAFTGINLDKNPRNIADTDLVETRNMYQYRDGELCNRPFYGIAPDKAPFAVASLGVNGLWSFPDRFGKRRIAIFSSTDGISFRFFEYGISGGFPSGTFGQLGPTRPGAVVWQNRLYVFPGGEISGIVLDAVDAITPLSGTPIDTAWTYNPRATVAAIYNDQFVLAGFPGTEGSTLRFCDINAPGTLLSDAKSVFVNQGDGDNINGLFDWPLEGGALFSEPYLYVYKQNSVWQFRGLPPTTTGDGTLSLTRVMGNEGLVAKETIALTPYGLVHCSGKNVWIIPRGGQPTRIGDNIRKLLETLPQTGNAGWCAAYHNGFYKLTVPQSGCVYSGQTGDVLQYWCDMRQFPNVTWWGPMDVPASAMFVDRYAVGQERLQVLVQNTSNSTVTLYEEGADTGAGDAFANVTPHFRVTTKDYTEKDSRLDKIFNSANVTMANIAPANVQVSLQTNGMLAGEASNVLAVGADPANLDSGNLDSNIFFNDAYVAYAFYPASGSRLLGKSCQAQIDITSAAGGYPARLVSINSIGLNTQLIRRLPT